MQSQSPHTLHDHQKAPWKTYTCEENILYLWQAGPLKVWLKRSNLEWQLAHELCEEEDSTESQWQKIDDEEPEDVSWERWAFSKPHEEIAFLPAMQERPLVVKTTTPTHIPSGMEAVFYVNIPMCAKVETRTSNEKTELLSVSSVTLSDTWFGNNFEGDLCYALKTKAVRSVSDAKPQPHRALCPILIANKADEPLPLQKICIRANYLNVYASDNRFWTNRISVNFLGKGVPSRVHYGTAPPAELKDPTLVYQASKRYESGFFKTLGQSFIDLF